MVEKRSAYLSNANRFTSQKIPSGRVLYATALFNSTFIKNEKLVSTMQRFVACGLVLLTALATGCGPNLGSVSGTVTLDGEPAEGLIVAFTPTDGGTSAATTTDADGKYVLVSSLGAGVPPGNYRVAITTENKVENTEEEAYTGGSDSAGYAAQAGGSDYSGAKKFKEKVPAEYNKNSTITKEVTTGENVIDFAIETK